VKKRSASRRETETGERTALYYQLGVRRSKITRMKKRSRISHQESGCQLTWRALSDNREWGKFSQVGKKSEKTQTTCNCTRGETEDDLKSSSKTRGLCAEEGIAIERD